MTVFNIAPVHSAHTVNIFLIMVIGDILKGIDKAYGINSMTHHLGKKWWQETEKLLKDLTFTPECK